MEMLALTDVVRFTHIFSVAVGFGAAFFADFTALSGMRKPVSRSILDTLHTSHGLVWKALIGMWITGLVMIFIRTDFALANFSPKLFSKLFTVSVLTINAFLIGHFAMPIVKKCLGAPLSSLSLRTKLTLGAIGAISSASWVMAMAMGVSKVLAKSGWDVFVELLPFGYIASVVGALVVMVWLHMLDRMPEPTPNAV